MNKVIFKKINDNIIKKHVKGLNEASSGEGAQACHCEMKYLIFSIPISGNEAKRGVVF